MDSLHSDSRRDPGLKREKPEETGGFWGVRHVKTRIQAKILQSAGRMVSRPDSRRRFVVLLLGFPRLRSQKPPMATPTAFFRFSPSTQPSGFWVFKARAPDPTGLWLSSSVWSSTWIEVCLVLLRDDVSILPNWFNPPNLRWFILSGSKRRQVQELIMLLIMPSEGRGRPPWHLS